MTKVAVNINKDASVKGLHEQLENLARPRATTVTYIVSKILTHATNNRAAYKPPLKNPGENPGKHIAAKVSPDVRTELTDWAKDQGSHRNKWCCFLLQKAFENGDVESIID